MKLAALFLALICAQASAASLYSLSLRCESPEGCASTLQLSCGRTSGLTAPEQYTQE